MWVTVSDGTEAHPYPDLEAALDPEGYGIALMRQSPCLGSGENGVNMETGFTAENADRLHAFIQDVGQFCGPAAGLDTSPRVWPKARRPFVTKRTAKIAA